MTYNWAQLTSEAMTNLFLYGDITTPENLATDELLRPLDYKHLIDIDAVSYMGSGPGRFIDPRNFEPISRFFSDAGRAEVRLTVSPVPPTVGHSKILCSSRLVKRQRPVPSQ